MKIDPIRYLCRTMAFGFIIKSLALLLSNQTRPNVFQSGKIKKVLN